MSFQRIDAEGLDGVLRSATHRVAPTQASPLLPPVSPLATGDLPETDLFKRAAPPVLFPVAPPPSPAAPGQASAEAGRTLVEFLPPAARSAASPLAPDAQPRPSASPQMTPGAGPLPRKSARYRWRPWALGAAAGLLLGILLSARSTGPLPWSPQPPPATASRVTGGVETLVVAAAAEEAVEEAVEAPEPLPLPPPQPEPEPRAEELTFDFPASYPLGATRPHHVAEAELEGLLATLRARCADRPVIVEGHTCSSGKPDANRRIGMARAQRVRALLVSRGLPPASLSARASVAPAGSGTGPAFRRVTVRCDLSKPFPAVPPSPQEPSR